MFVSARMKKIEILTLVSDEPKVTEAVGEMGVLHLTRSPVEGGATPVAGPETAESQAHLAELHSRALTLCEMLGLDADTPAEEAPYPTLMQVEGDLNRISDQVRPLVEEREALAGRRGQIEKLLRDTSMLREIDAPLEQLEELSFLHFAIGGMSGEAATAANDELGDRAVVLPYTTPYGEERVVAISSKKGRWTLETALEEHGFEREKLPEDQKGIPARIAELAEQQMTGLLEQIKANNAAARESAGAHGAQLLAILKRLLTESAVIQARENFAHTWATMLITGWIPAEKVTDLCRLVLDITAGRAVIEVRDPADRDGEPPTKLSNHPLIRPFEMLVSSYSTPHYNEIEPTPFIAVLFLLMFGLMFGDVGHSGLLLIAGIAMWIKGKEKIHDVGVIMTFCGISGMIFGAIYGSVFGEGMVVGHFGWLHPNDEAPKVLAITVAFGIAVISLGIILNIINRVRRRELAEVTFDKFGIVGGIFYWGALIIAARGFVTGGVNWILVVLLIVAPLMAVFLHKPVHMLLAKRRGRPVEDDTGIFVTLIESGAEVFEMVLAYVANTLSFARIGAFALAHAGLSVAVFELIKIVGEMPGGPVWTALVFVFGTALIVILEGLIVTIQSLRLEYYEFFGKFFRGEGRRYEPFHLKGTN
jgi:V/A-type H+/Na+-transporting ATPase subunit I